MKADNIVSFERQVSDLVRSVISEYSIGLRQHGYLSERIAFHHSDDYETNYESEVEITFWQDEHLMDVIEFFIYRNGNPVATLEEIDTWFRQQLKELIFEAQKGRSKTKYRPD
jgi:hypothetical protein